MCRLSLLFVVFATALGCASSVDELAQSEHELQPGEVAIVAQQRAIPDDDWTGQFFPPVDETVYVVGYFDAEMNHIRWTGEFRSEIEDFIDEFELSGVDLTIAGLQASAEGYLDDTWSSFGAVEEEHFGVGTITGEGFRACLRAENREHTIALNLFRLVRPDDTPVQANGRPLIVRTPDQRGSFDVLFGGYHVWIYEPPPDRPGFDWLGLGVIP